MPTVTFTYADVAAEASQPEQARKHIPQWYRDLDRTPPVTLGELPIGTVKVCSPFRDALAAGYMIRLPQAVHVVSAGDQLYFSWRTPRRMFVIERHSPTQVQGAQWPHSSVFKFTVPWALSLPPGYSALFTHPLNRYDLPFLTCSGVVDSDTYDSPVNFPFVWTGGEGECWLDAGLPIAQVIPIWREEWESEIKRVEEDDLRRSVEISATSIEGYRRLFRSRKVYR